MFDISDKMWWTGIAVVALLGWGVIELLLWAINYLIDHLEWVS